MQTHYLKDNRDMIFGFDWSLIAGILAGSAILVHRTAKRMKRWTCASYVNLIFIFVISSTLAFVFVRPVMHLVGLPVTAEPFVGSALALTSLLFVDKVLTFVEKSDLETILRLFGYVKDTRDDNK